MMKTIGLIGGMSWESSLIYYRIINERVREAMGGFHSARCVMYSLDFSEIETLQRQQNWAKATELMVDAAQRLKRAGAEFLVICTNTMHKMADEVEQQAGLPLLHIADATARQVKEQGIRTIGLLGTRYTMEEEFYRGRLTTKHGLDVLIPGKIDRGEVNRVIYEELVMGVIKETSKHEYQRIIQDLIERGAQGVILGCTEIGLLVKDSDTPLPLFDTTQIHAEAAVDYALQ